MTITITISRVDIERGIRCDAGSCPAALALNRVLGKGCHSSVGKDWVYLFADDRPPLRIAIPAALRAFVVDFDTLRPCRPFAFDLDIPAEWIGGDA